MFPLLLASAVPLVMSASPATAAGASITARLSGSDRFATAIAVSNDAWASQQAQSVVLARSDAFPDALAGTPLAVRRNAPLLLTSPGALNSNVAQEIKRVLPAGRIVYLLGGTAAISPSVADAVARLGYRVVRLAGPDRYTTAVTISKQLGTPSTIFLATGSTFQNALISGVAAASSNGVVVLTADAAMPVATRSFLDSLPSVERVAVGPEATAAEPGATSVAGSSVYETARLLAERYFPHPAAAAVASGAVFADALAGGAHIGRLAGPLLLSEPTRLPTPIGDYLSLNRVSIATATLYGGTTALSTTVEDAVRSHLSGTDYAQLPDGANTQPALAPGEQLGGGRYDNASIADQGLSHLGQNLYTAGPLDHGQCKQAVNDWVFEASGHTQRLGGNYYENYSTQGGDKVSRDNAVKGDVIQLTNPSDHVNYYYGMHTAIVLSHTPGSNTFDVVDSNYVARDTVGRHNWDPYASAAKHGLEVTLWRMGTAAAAAPEAAPAPTPAPPASTPGGVVETAGGVANSWTDYSNAGGTAGPQVAAHSQVYVACKVTGFRVADGNTWWYRLASAPWNGAYYVSADAFYNNGATSGSLAGTPFVDPAVPDCAAPAPTPAPRTYAETAGGVAQTWTNYSSAGGTQGPTVASQQTIQVACKITGFKVADGNTWWYRIAQSPWNSAYYVSADAFYNNGATSGSLSGTPFVDPAVPPC